jgi:hypothetical protein
VNGSFLNVNDRDSECRSSRNDDDDDDDDDEDEEKEEEDGNFGKSGSR